MGFSVGDSGRKVRPSMNVTPLVDVVLVLLIIFMVITPLMSQQLSVNVPVKNEDSAGSERPPEPQVILWVSTEGEVYINRDPVSDDELPAKLQRIFAARRDQTLFFDAEDNTPYGRALEVLDIARGAGIVTIAVLTEAIRR